VAIERLREPVHQQVGCHHASCAKDLPAARVARYGRHQPLANIGRMSAPALTPREAEVLTLAAQGFRSAAIADQLGVSHSTITAHLNSVFRKLGVGTRQEAAEVAASLGLF
jgi:DNA-binding CsgD family transcriptional regulator